MKTQQESSFAMPDAGQKGRSIGRRVLRDEIRERLTEDILSGRLKPGARLIETHIAKEFGISQGPVREALRDLELLGFVVSSAFRGSQVRFISNDELVQIYPIRAALEGLAARAAASNLDEVGLNHLEDLINVMHNASARADRKVQSEADIAFHRFIIEASGNRLLKQFWETMRLATTTFLSMSKTHRPLSELADRHKPVLMALRARDPIAAEAAMRNHIEEIGKWILSEYEPVNSPAVHEEEIVAVEEK
ncbi:MAG TPA: GntR family transcriptional regulator [Acidobacteriaceae bacterium]|nr:GntR family transcriptional regulator [Acidobacteriaceae bacterium]